MIVGSMIKIAYLADHLDMIPTLSEWALAWAPDYYGSRSLEDIGQDFRQEARRTGIPIRLIAFLDSELAGMINLREQAMQGYPQYSPALGGLYVLPAFRKQGVATAMVKAIMELARKEKHDRIYTSTATANGIIERLGWEPVRAVMEGDRELMIYQYDIL